MRESFRNSFILLSNICNSSNKHDSSCSEISTLKFVDCFKLSCYKLMKFIYTSIYANSFQLNIIISILPSEPESSHSFLATIVSSSYFILRNKVKNICEMKISNLFILDLLNLNC